MLHILWSPRYGLPIPIERITLFDVPSSLDHDHPAGGLPDDLAADDRIRVMTGDLTEEGVAAEIVDDDSLAVVHLASMVSGDTEADHLKGWQVNVEGQRRLLEALRTRAPLLAASTGVVGATVVAMGLISLPAMRRAGYDEPLASGLICAAGSTAQIIPPSTLLIILSDVMSNAYQQAQFDAGKFTIDTIKKSIYQK